MTLIRKPFELDVQTKIKALIYGQAGSGKSTLALSAPKPLLLDFDGGVHRINYQHQVPTVQISKWEDCENVLKENLDEYETLVIDTGGKMLDYMSDFIMRTTPKYKQSSGALTLQGYGVRKSMFRQFCKQTMIMGKHLVFIAHRETQKEGDETRYVPLFGGSSYDDLVTDLDLVGYLEVIGKKRVITFDPTGRNDGKNTCNLPSAMELPTVADKDGNGLKNTFLADNVIDRYVANLEKRKELSSKFNEVMADVKEQIALITDAKSANEFIKNITSFEHTGNSKTISAQLLQAHAKTLNLKFDQESKMYV